MDFGEVLGRAWKIIWKHKILWIFGIFAGCARGGGGGGGNSGARVTGGGGNFPPFQQFSLQINDWIAAHWWVLILFFLVVVVIIILALLLGTIGKIGLIRGTVKADAGAEHLGFMELWDESRPFFWRIFWLAVVVVLAAIIVLLPILAAFTAFTAITFGIGLICLLPLICVLVIALWALQLVVQQAESAIVIENLGIQDGLRRGWEVFRKNLGPMLIMWLILIVIGFITGLIIALPLLVVLVPSVIAFAVSAQNGSQPSYAPLIIGLLCCTAYFPFLLVLNGIRIAYLDSAWALTFLRLTRPTGTSSVTLVESPAPPAPTPNA